MQTKVLFTCLTFKQTYAYFIDIWDLTAFCGFGLCANYACAAYYLCLRRWTPKIHRDFYLLQVFDGSVAGFVTLNVFGEGLHKTLGVLWGKYHPRLYFTFWRTWHHIYKVNDKLCIAVRNNSKVGVTTFCYFF